VRRLRRDDFPLGELCSTKTGRDFGLGSWSNARMKNPRAIVWLAVGIAVVLTAIWFGGGKMETHPATPADELTALRQEVAALRAEVETLRRNAGGRSPSGQSLDDTTLSPASAPVGIYDQVKALKDQLAATQRELSSNLVQIAVDRGGDAWKRGDFKEALKILGPLAESGHPIAEHRLGVMYIFGQGVPKDTAEAIKLFSSAAEKGQGESQHSLGLRYLWGDGTDKNPETAAAWFTAAANQGIPDSATWLGDMYWKGDGVKQDMVEGYKWLLLAGDKFTINHRQMTLDQFATQLTPDQIAEAIRRAKEFVPKRTGPEDF